MEEKEFFRLYQIEEEKLISYGFIKKESKYQYSTYIMNNEFQMIVEVDQNNIINTQLKDVFTNEEYILHKIKKANGTYVTKVKEAYEDILEDIKRKCMTKEIFRHTTTKEIIQFIFEMYNDQLEFLWGEDSQSAVFRRKDVNKWYGIIMVIPKRKLGYESDDLIEIMNLKGNASEIIDNSHYFPAYHMNKKTWFTIDLTSKINLDEVKAMIKNSYDSLKKS